MAVPRPWLLSVLAIAWLATASVANEGRWSPFDPIGAPTPPAVEDVAWAGNPVDAFVRARLEEAGIAPAPEVDRRVWLRRVTFDLTGLPPEPEAVRDFLADARPDALARARVVDRLLASPAYGERWARHWLDVVRYADSDGFAIDSERPTLWRYRDHVIRTFNEDRPFDEFIREQVAGDELDGGSEALVALGFYRLGPWEADNMVAERRRQDFLNEITAAVGSAFLGLTLGCARCHDHKYDPIPAQDFYRLQACLAPLERADVAAPYLASEESPHFIATRERLEGERRRRAEALREFRDTLRARLRETRGGGDAPAIDDKALDEALGAAEPFRDAEKKRHAELQKAVEDFKDAARVGSEACAVRAHAGGDPPATHILLGGDVAAPGEAVAPGVLADIGAPTEPYAAELAALSGNAAGRRRVLAEWLTSPDNPLPARVLANRVWQHHFGQGIVATPDDFGQNGSGASHPALLDHLARRLIEGGWRLKPLHRLLVLSRTYRSASRHPEHDVCAAEDPANRLLWRAPFRRLEAEAVRDAMLAVGGELSRVAGGPGFFARLPEELGRDFPFFRWEPSAPEERRRRSIYMFQRRNMVPPLMEALDAADMNEPCGRRNVSVTTPQALSLFNGAFAHEASRHFAARLRREAGDEPGAQVDRAFELALGRPPRAEERERAVAFVAATVLAALEREETATDAEAGDPLADLCLVLFNTNEFVYLE